MNWTLVVLSGLFSACTGALAWIAGRESARSHILSWRAPKASKREDETVLVHEGALDGDALRFTLRSKSRVASFLVPREMVYQMSDDLLRAAAQLGKRKEPQRGPE